MDDFNVDKTRIMSDAAELRNDFDACIKLVDQDCIR